MGTTLIVSLASISLSITGLILANAFLMMMIGEINRKRQDGNLISYFGFTFPKMQLIFNEYRFLYPYGNKHLYAILAFAVAIIGLVGVADCLGFFN